MQPDIVIAYLRAAFGSAIRMVVAVVVIIAINVLLNADFVRDALAHRQRIVDWLAPLRPLWPAAALAIGATLLIAPWACFRFAQWRYKELDARAVLPRQRRELSLPVARADAFALALRAMQDDPALYAVHADADAGTIDARAVPLRGRSTAFANRRTGEAAAAASGDRWPDGLLRLIDALHVGPPARRMTLNVGAQATDAKSASHATIAIDARMRTWFPAVDICGRNRRHVDALANTLIARVQPLIAQRRDAEDKVQLQSRLLDARLQVLRAQIEPHFLYNTLANVQYLTRSDPPAAAAMVGALIDYLRHALPRMREGRSTLGEEMTLARAYLDILRIRMGSRLTVAITCPAALADHPFPPMMLMSLVENAIKHGLEPKPGGGGIAIDAAVDENSLRVTVADDGVGFGADAGNGIGLTNVRETLASLFGVQSRLTVEPAAQGGVVATIAVPRVMSTPPATLAPAAGGSATVPAQPT